jgi:GT2 family glycosyltransferase
MEARAPAVVAVVVTTDPAPGLEAALTTLVGQDYPELSVLVMANAGDAEVVSRVAAVAPNAFVKVLDENRGFSAACNEAALMVTGAAFLLFCHDDVLFFEGAVSQLVEAAFRANAGIVSPKVVAYDDPFILVHVGQVADRFGTVRERVELGEIDHGQQDLERDVFVAPGGVTLVRTDLFETLHGFDPLIPVLGEDLDLCWRAQVAGARIIVAPSAVVAHRQTLATGERLVTAVGTRHASRMDLQRRHQLATVLTCWGPRELIAVVPALVALDLGESLVALVGRDGDRLGAIAGAWRWVWRNRRHLRQRRRELSQVRALGDGDVARLQIGGASRLTTFVTTLFQDGLDRARGILPEVPEVESESAPDSVGFAAAFSEEESFDEIAALDDGGRRHRLGRLLTGAQSQLVLVGLVALVWLYGARNLVATPLPDVGRLAPLDSWWGTWRHFFASWSPNGVGTGTPGMPGYGVLGFAGTFVFGRMGVLPRLVMIFAVPLGALGTWRLLRSVVSNRARLLGAVAYAAFPAGVNLVEAGRIDVLVTSAVLPFAVRRVLVLLDVEGFRSGPLDETVAFGHRGFGASRSGQIAVLLLQVALMTALAPAALVVVELVIVGLVLSQRLAPMAAGRLDRPWGLAGNVLGGTAILLLPMTYNTLAAGWRALGVFGLRGGPWSALSLSALLRGADGPFGAGWGGWLLPGVAAAALFIARGERRALVARFASVLALAVLVAALCGRGWLGSFAPDPDSLVVLIGLGVAVLVALAVSSIENDLTATRFSWRHLIAGASVVLVVGASLPLIAQSSSGRFDLPSTGTPESLGSLVPSALGGYRVLWLGEPDVLPVAGWSVAPGLAAATTTNSLPEGDTLFSPPDPGAAGDLLHAVGEALAGQTVRLGQLLAPSGISTIVVMTSPAPTLSGLQHVATDAPPARLVASLERQDDLAVSARSPGVIVFTNALFHGIVASRPAPLSSRATSSESGPAHGWTPALDFAEGAGPLAHGTVLAGLAPASAFQLEVDGRDSARTVSLGWAAVFHVPTGSARLVLHQLPLNALIAAVTLGLWLTFLLGFGALESLERLTRRRSRAPRVTMVPRADPETAP